MVHDLFQQKDNNFVFVVCGASKHIQTLNYSLGHLKHFSQTNIIVVTDLSRNDGVIEHENIVNVETPTEFDHHQASIYLKTRLHKIVDLNNRYCYLDTDVVAVDEKVDELFDHQIEPIIFSTDHCPVIEFSANAINCNCSKMADIRRQKFEELAGEYVEVEKAHNKKYKPSDPEVYKDYLKLKQVLLDYERDYAWFTKTHTSIQFILSHLLPSKFNFVNYLLNNGGFVWKDEERKIYDSKGNLLYDDREPYPSYYKYIERISGFRWDSVNKIWLNDDGYYLYSERCSHLLQEIERKFNITIDNSWQHWNGGVFLFNASSVEFMDTWHDYTMQIFEDDNWKTRDQGTLIATAWKFGLQNQKTLPIEFNFLADYGNEKLKFMKDKGFSYNGFASFTQPHFLHVYHHFGDKNWEVWKYVEDIIYNQENLHVSE